MRKVKLSLAFSAIALMALQSCKKNESTRVDPGGTVNDVPGKTAHWNPGDAIVNGKYRFVQYENPSKAVCVFGNFTTDGAQIHHWSYASQGAAQQWNIVNRQTVSGTVYYSIENVNSGKALEVPSVNAEGTQLEQRTYTGNDRQLWSIKHVIYTVYLIVNKATNKALTLDPAAADPGADGVKITQTTQTWPGSGKQHFFFHNLDEFFVNPLRLGAADPWVYKKDGYYYYLCTQGSSIKIWKTAKMSELRTATSVTVALPAGYPSTATQDLWAPELHFLDGKWYIYVCGDNGSNPNHRMYVLENANADPTTGSWTYKGKITDATDRFAIDATILEYGGNRYMLWCGSADATVDTGKIFIAQMSNPWTITGPRAMISEPIYSWERVGNNTNEAPQVVKNSNGDVFLIYSASACNQNYKMGRVRLATGADPMVKANWTKTSTAVFETNVTNSAYGPGHCSFFKSGTEDWLVYHAFDYASGACDGSRSTRMQKFTWNGSNEPNFGVPESVNTALRQPAGE